MSAIDIAQQLINGAAFDFSTIEVVIGPRTFARVNSINYEHGVDQGEVRGTSPFVLATTRGQYSASGSMTIYKEDFDQLTTMLLAMPGPGAAPAGGYMEKRFPIVVTYAEASSQKLVTDTLIGCRILRARDAHSAGADSLNVEMDLHIMKVLHNGKHAIFDNTFRP